MLISKVPDCGAGNLTEYCNYAGYFDRKMIGINYMFSATEPEGIFSTLPSLFNTYIGVYFAIIYFRNRQ